MARNAKANRYARALIRHNKRGFKDSGRPPVGTSSRSVKRSKSETGYGK